MAHEDRLPETTPGHGRTATLCSASLPPQNLIYGTAACYIVGFITVLVFEVKSRERRSNRRNEGSRFRDNEA